jgi:hypothetical protein
MKTDWFVKLCLGVIALCLLSLTLRPYAPGVAVAGEQEPVAKTQAVHIQGPVEVKVVDFELSKPVAIKTESFDGLKVEGTITLEPSYRALKVEVQN